MLQHICHLLVGPKCDSNTYVCCCSPFVSTSTLFGHILYLFLFLSEAVPHGRHNLGDIPKGSIGVLALDGCLGVSEEECIGRHGFLWLIGVLLLLLLLRFGFGLHHFCGGTLLTVYLEKREREEGKMRERK